MSNDQLSEFDKAKIIPAPFGKYRGLSLNLIAKDDEGLLYLHDFMQHLQNLNEPFRNALKVFLSDPRVIADVEELHAARAKWRGKKLDKTAARVNPQPTPPSEEEEWTF